MRRTIAPLAALCLYEIALESMGRLGGGAGLGVGFQVIRDRQAPVSKLTRHEWSASDSHRQPATVPGIPLESKTVELGRR